EGATTRPELRHETSARASAPRGTAIRSGGGRRRQIITKNARYGHVRGGLRTKGDRAYPPFSSRRVRPRLVTQRGRKTTPMSQASNPTVGILMGSASDWPTMQ